MRYVDIHRVRRNPKIWTSLRKYKFGNNHYFDYSFIQYFFTDSYNYCPFNASDAISATDVVCCCDHQHFCNYNVSFQSYEFWRLLHDFLPVVSLKLLRMKNLKIWKSIDNLISVKIIIDEKRRLEIEKIYMICI